MNLPADLPEKIKSIYDSVSEAEKAYLRKILEELAETGYSSTYENIWLTDFKSVPVDIDTFVCDPYYLGSVNRNGDAVYPFWRKTLREIFSAGNKYNEIILSGATRIGKSSTAIIIMAYMLYRLMMYRNPHTYFQKKEISKFSIVFANLTKDLALGVAYREFQDTLRASPFFNEHGSFTRSDRNFYYVPEGNNIEIIAVSDGAQALGKQCLVGNTKLLTPDGYKLISECEGTNQVIYQLLEDGSLEPTEADVVLTKYVNETIRIELEDGSVIEGTPDHKVMLSDGSYKELQELTSSEDLMTLKLDAIDHTNFNCYNKISTVYTNDKIRKKLFDLSELLTKDSDFLCKQRFKTSQKIHHDIEIPVYDVVNVQPNHNFAVLSNSVLISHNCWCCFLDEVSFARSGVKDINKAKEHMKNLYDTVNARVSGTFRLGGEVYGKLIAGSSKNQDNDFLSTHIETQLNSGNTHLYIVDQPQWKILPPSMFSDKKFHFTVGDRYKRGFVIPEENDDDAHIQEYISQGYKIVEAPEELRRNFLADYDISLRDIAGISVVGAMGFITQDAITPIVSQDRHNPFYTDTIQIGTRDNSSIEQYFHIESVPSNLKNCYMAIHLDLAEISDRQGICGVCVDGNKVVEDINGKKVSLPFYREIFCVGIEAPKGDRMSYQKVVNFLLWLRRQGFNIGIVSTDQFQSSYMREMLSQQGFNTKKISVDRSMEPYIGLKNVIYDQRIELIKHQLQEDELVNLKRMNNKFDHDSEHSKDCSDALCGAIWDLVEEKITPTPAPKSIAKTIASINGRHTNNRSNIAGFNFPVIKHY